MAKLKKVLSSDVTYFVLFIITCVYLIYSFNMPKQSIYNLTDEQFEGRAVKHTITDNKIAITIAGEEKLVCNYYSDDTSEKENMRTSIPLGSFVHIEGSLSVPLNNTIPNTFNYREYLEDRGIYYTCTINSIEVVRENHNIFYAIKNGVLNRIMTFEIKDYLNTMIVGDKSLLDSETLEKYRDNGVTHLFAISGMHIGLFAIILAKIFKKCKMRESTSLILTSLFIWFYAFLAGFGASVVRAGLIFTYLAIDKIGKINLNKIKILLLTGFTLILCDYRIVKDIGFIYSFVTTFGLMWSSKVLSKHKILGTSLVASLFSLPITINNFFKINLASIAFNVVFVPLVSVIVYPLCLITFFVRCLEPLTAFMIELLELLNTLCASFDLFQLVVPKMNFIVVIFYYTILLFCINKSLYKVSALLIALILLNKAKPLLDTFSYVEFMDVGQGDSAIIRSARSEEVILIDTGGKMNASSSAYYVSDNVITYLNSLGIAKIDYLILTHGDYDHMGETGNLVNNLKVEKVIFNCGEYNDLENESIKVLEKKKIEHHSCIKELNIGNNKLYFLNTKEYDNENDNSNVIYTELNNRKFLFMGDASTLTEKEILEKYDLLDIDVLKVGHHGSKTSSGKSFINTINPKYSIISVGKNNRYGHPNKEILENLEDSKIYRTDIDGSIMFKFKKGQLDIKTCPP